MELTGRTQQCKPLVCKLKQVLDLKRINGPNYDVAVTDEGEFRLGIGIKKEDLEIGVTYFFQTIDFGPKAYRRIEIVDYLKFEMP